MDISSSSTHSTRTPTLAPKVRMLQRRRASALGHSNSCHGSSSFACGEDEDALLAASCSNLYYQEATTNLASMVGMSASKTPLPLRRTHSTASSSSSGERLQAITQEVLTLVGSVGVVAPSSSSSQTKKEMTTSTTCLQSTDQYRPGFDMDVAYLAQALGVPPSFLLGQELTKQRVKSMGRTTTTSHKKNNKNKDVAASATPKRSPGKTSSRKSNEKKKDTVLVLQEEPTQDEIPNDDATSQTVSSSCSSSSSVDSVQQAKQQKKNNSFWEAVSTKMLQTEPQEWIQSLSEDDYDPTDDDDDVASVSSQSTSKHSNTRKATTTLSVSSTTAAPMLPLTEVAFVMAEAHQDYDCCTNLDDVLFGNSKQYQLQVLEDQFRQAQQLQVQHTKALEAAQHKVDATDRRLAWQAQMGL